MIKGIDAYTVKIWLDQNEVELIDVREPSEYSVVSIPGAKLIPLGGLVEEKLEKPSGKIVLYCKSGGRSAKGCSILQSQNPDLEVYSLEGGITKWMDFGLEVKKSNKPIKCSLPIDAQVRMLSGGVALTGSVLALFVAESFVIIPLLVGAGLLISGITNSCPMASFLGKMPWNN